MKEIAAIYSVPGYIRVIEQIMPRHLERCIDLIGPLAGQVDNYYERFGACITSYFKCRRLARDRH